MSTAFVNFIEIHGVWGYDALQGFTQAVLMGLKEQVDMVGHETIGVKFEFFFFFGLSYIAKKFKKIIGIVEDIFFVYTTSHHMINSATTQHSACSWHLPPVVSKITFDFTISALHRKYLYLVACTGSQGRFKWPIKKIDVISYKSAPRGKVLTACKKNIKLVY